MLQVTEKAVEMIKDFLKDRGEEHIIRLMMNEGGWSGPSLGMALDEPRDGDEIFKENGITFLINKELFELVKPITVDFISTPRGSGFKVSSSLETGSSCGKSCSSC